MSNNWTQLGLSINGDQDYSYSGSSVSISSDGTTIAIGAPLYNNGTTNSSDRGQVKIFNLDACGNLIQKGQSIFGDGANNNFGYSVSLSANGTFVAVGAKGGGYSKIYKFINNSFYQFFLFHYNKLLYIPKT